MLTEDQYISKILEFAKLARDSAKNRILAETSREELLNISADLKIDFAQENIFEVQPISKTFKYKILNFELQINVPKFNVLTDPTLSNVKNLFEEQIYHIFKDNLPKSIVVIPIKPDKPKVIEKPKEFNHKPVLIGLSVVAATVIGTALYMGRKV